MALPLLRRLLRVPPSSRAVATTGSTTQLGATRPRPLPAFPCLQEFPGCQVVGIPADVSQPAAVERLCARAAEELGQIVSEAGLGWGGMGCGAGCCVCSGALRVAALLRNWVLQLSSSQVGPPLHLAPAILLCQDSRLGVGDAAFCDAVGSLLCRSCSLPPFLPTLPPTHPPTHQLPHDTRISWYAMQRSARAPRRPWLPPPRLTWQP